MILLQSSTTGKPRLECKFYEQLERVLGPSASSTSVPEVTYQVEEGMPGDPQDGPEDWQVLGHAAAQEDIGTKPQASID